jgi:hypothetical protein
MESCTSRWSHSVPAHQDARLPKLGSKLDLKPLTASRDHGHDGVLRREHQHLVPRIRTRVDVGVTGLHADPRQHLCVRGRGNRLALSASLGLALRALCASSESRQEERDRHGGGQHCDGQGSHNTIVNTPACPRVKCFAFSRAPSFDRHRPQEQYCAQDESSNARWETHRRLRSRDAARTCPHGRAGDRYASKGPATGQESRYG